MKVEQINGEWVVTKKGKIWAGPFPSKSAAREWLSSYKAYPF